MATIMIGSARIDENGNSTGGAAGDQKQTSSTNDTAGEVSMQTMYTHSKGWYIFRPKSVTHANKIAERMKAACNNANIGYDQSNRLGIVTYGIDTKTKTECDCSSLMRVVIKEATGTDPGNFTTATEATYLAKTGLFEDKVKYVSQSSTPVANGDVLVTCSSGHTVAVVSGNPRTETTLTAGSKIALSSTALYCASTAKTKSNTLTGDYYIWSSDIVNSMIRITNKASNAGKTNAVTGWVKVADIPGASSSSAVTSGSSSSGSSTKIDAAKSFNKSFAKTYAVDTAKGLNLRTTPGSTESKTIIVALPNKTQVRCYGYYTTVSNVNWFCVQVVSGSYSGKEGYCSSEFLK